ncbi:hypothetical protein DGMP_03810 [Desulfomarina profundi]|uniref:Uncharacterized protein n=1 Tax=Desulfomarina profundi TaxID=2772557 RepID=A0A8D5JCJ3_9BACT|nr:hypothetical protein [Desulfomarina profundi]BCL59688.1 hypothetical protein DGMP_03810 [Desulfomarina profundi]
MFACFLLCIYFIGRIFRTVDSLVATPFGRQVRADNTSFFLCGYLEFSGIDSEFLEISVTAVAVLLFYPLTDSSLSGVA